MELERRSVSSRVEEGVGGAVYADEQRRHLARDLVADRRSKFVVEFALPALHRLVEPELARTQLDDQAAQLVLLVDRCTRDPVLHQLLRIPAPMLLCLVVCLDDGGLALVFGEELHRIRRRHRVGHQCFGFG
jgi:hypothetical protein